jgi:hypothetical protein
VQHLDGNPSAVPVRRRIDRRHTAHANYAVERPLATENTPGALFDAIDNGTVYVGHRGSRS